MKHGACGECSVSSKQFAALLDEALHDETFSTTNDTNLTNGTPAGSGKDRGERKKAC
ncbi:hypothetical protein Rhal01_03705 [Rubritalea halochordaticola]|uniref:NIF system FeS cluster assembly NifU N-terminal domain-containing protein n=1 Tax=Rubritalea halochordaticola TaxID=714537 RepID=A0ABP9V7I4_9BACT